MSDLADLASGLLVLAGAAFALLACAGLWRFDDLYSRIHSATKATTLGMVLTALGAAFQMSGNGDRAKLLLACILQLVTAPVSAHMVARASYRTGSVRKPGTSVDHLAEDLAAEDLAPED